MPTPAPDSAGDADGLCCSHFGATAGPSARIGASHAAPAGGSFPPGIVCRTESVSRVDDVNT